jgi:DNA-binding XRE family transcriptional regulator
MKMKIKKFTGHSVDVKSLIAKKRAESPAFRAAYDEARSVRLLSRALAELRERSGLTQAQLAKRLHTTQAAISRLESPTYRSHSLATLRKYLKATGSKMVIRFERSDDGAALVVH